jgi:hypothetical protein
MLSGVCALPTTGASMPLTGRWSGVGVGVCRKAIAPAALTMAEDFRKSRRVGMCTYGAF